MKYFQIFTYVLIFYSWSNLVSPVGKVLDFLSHICNQLVLAFAFKEEQNVLRVVVVFLQHIFRVYNINMTIKLFKYICFKCKAVDSSISQSLGFYICSFVDCMETQTSLGLDSTGFLFPKNIELTIFSYIFVLIKGLFVTSLACLPSLIFWETT